MSIKLNSSGGGSVTIQEPTTASAYTLTLPAANGSILTDGSTVTVAQGGTGSTSLTANNVILGNGTSAVQVVAPGTNGNVLTSNGTTWTSAAAPVSAVKQIVSVSKTDTFSVASSSFTDITGLSASITPSSTSSRIFIIVNTMTSSNSSDAVSIRIYRNNNTAVGVATGTSNRPASLAVNGFWSNSAASLSGSFVDSPASTSTQTYAIQGRIQTGTLNVNRTNTDSDNGVYPRGISTITLMEIV
jgi:hypothetical protein